MQKLQSMWWWLQFINQNIEIKNATMIIFGLKEAQNWHSFLLSYKNGYRFIIYMIVNNIFEINKFWIQLNTGWNDKIVIQKKTTLQLYFKTFIEKINSGNLIM